MPENSGKMFFQDRVLMEHCYEKLLKAVESTSKKLESVNTFAAAFYFKNNHMGKHKGFKTSTAWYTQQISHPH